MTIELTAVSVDDEQPNLMIIEAMAENLNVNIHSFESPVEAFEFISNNTVDLIFVDYMMPDLNGIELTKKVREKYTDIPIVMITSVNDDSSLKLKAIQAGATEFLNKPLDPAEFKARVTNMIELRQHTLLLRDRARHLKFEVERATVDIRDREYETLVIIGRAAEYKDDHTGTHIKRVSHISRLLAELAGEDEESREIIFNAAPLHDIGKIGIADSILGKPGKLNEDEWAFMRRHPMIGYKILKDAKSTYIKSGAVISLTHHERYDGRGYPRGLQGEGIDLYGRIVAIADVYDALITRRPYKEPWEETDVLFYFEDQKGKHFDPGLVEHLLRNMDRVREIYEKIPSERDNALISEKQIDVDEFR